MTQGAQNRAADPAAHADVSSEDRQSRGAEVLIRVAVGSLGGLAAILLVAAVTPALGLAHRIWACVIGLSSIMAMAGFAGIARREANKTRRIVKHDMDAISQRLERIEALMSLRADVEYESTLDEVQRTVRGLAGRQTELAAELEEHKTLTTQRIASALLTGLRGGAKVLPLKPRKPAG